MEYVEIKFDKVRQSARKNRAHFSNILSVKTGFAAPLGTERKNITKPSGIIFKPIEIRFKC